MRKASPYFSTYFLDTVMSSFLRTFQKPRTASEYFGNVCRICDYIAKDFLELTEDDVEKYFSHLYSRYRDGDLSRKTINVRLSTYNSLSQYICDTFPELNFNSPFKNQKLAEFDSNVSVSSVPSLKEMDIILSAAKDNPMFYLIFSLACRVAMPASRILSINRNNMHIEGDMVVLSFSTDYGEPFFIKLPSDVSQLLLSYINTHPSLDGSGHVFFNKRGRHLTLLNLEVGAKKIFDSCNLAGHYTLNSLKARAIVDMRKAGVQEVDIAKYAGLSASRVSTYKLAASMIVDCPADLVNFKIITEETAS